MKKNLSLTYLEHLILQNKNMPKLIKKRQQDFCIKKFHQYLYGNHFILATDHKLLTYIFNKKRGLPQVAANRTQRYALFLAGYDYTIQYIKSSNNQNADALSRLALPYENCKEVDIPTIHFINDYFQGVNKTLIQNKTKRVDIVSVGKKYILTGWPDLKIKNNSVDIKPFYLQKK